MNHTALVCYVSLLNVVMEDSQIVVVSKRMYPSSQKEEKHTAGRKNIPLFRAPTYQSFAIT
jgi:hypothetical protein